MCFAAGALIGVAMSVAQSVVSFSAAQADYQDRAQQWKQNYVNALASGRDEQKQLTLRLLEEGEAHSQKAHLTNIEQAKLTAEHQTSAAHSGVAGISVDNLIIGVQRDIGAKRVADKTNYQNKVVQLSANLEATNTKITNRINSVARPRSPSPLGFALQGVGGALKAVA